MSWGGAPPWVYKNQVSHAQDSAWRAQREASEANELAKKLADDNIKCNEKLTKILEQIVKYQMLANSKKLSKKEMTTILDDIKKAVLTS